MILLLCWCRYLSDSLRGVTWTPDNWACTVRDVRGKRRCPDAEACWAWIAEHGEAAPGAAEEAER